MMRQKLILATAVAAMGLGSLASTLPVQASGFFDAMNPSRWFGGDRYDRYDRDYYYGRGPYGWGGPYGDYGPYGGYGPYGWGGYPGYGGYGGYPSTIVVNPGAGGGDKAPPAPRLPE